jgi:hypothetical protein
MHGARYGVAGAFALTVMGCHHAGGNAALLDRAAHDLQCPRDSISILEGGKERDVEGCRRRATYVWTGRAWVPADQQPTTYGQGGPLIVYPGQGATPYGQQPQFVQQSGTPYVPQPPPGYAPAQWPQGQGPLQTPYAPAQPVPYAQPQPVPYAPTLPAGYVQTAPGGAAQPQPR